MARDSRDKDLAHGRLVRQRFFASANARVPRLAAWDEARELYDPSYVDRKKVRTPPFVKVPYVYRQVNTQVSQLLTASEANGSWIRVRSTTPEGANLGDVVTVLLDNQFLQKCPEIRRNTTDTMERCARMGDLYGCAFIHLSYREWEDGWGVTAENISCYDVFPDWVDGRWFIVRRWMTLSELREWAMGMGSATTETVTDPDTGMTFEVEGDARDDGRAQKAFEELMSQIAQGRALNRSVLGDTDGSSSDQAFRMGRVGDSKDSGSGTDASAQDDPFNARVEVLQYHETARDGIISVVVPGMAEDLGDIVFQKERNPYKCCTIIHYTPDPADNDLWGFGSAETSGPLQEVMSYNLRSFMRITAKNSDAPMLVPKSLGLPRHFIDSPGGKNIEVMGDPRSITYLASGVDGGAHHFAMQSVKMVADLGSGMSDQRRGQAGGASSATEAAITEASGNTVDRLRFRRWKRFVEQVGYAMLQILKVHVTNRRVIPALGRDAGRFIELRPEWLQGSFEVEFAGTPLGMTPAQEVSAWESFATTFAAAGVVDVAAVARRVAMRLGERDPDTVMLAKAGRPQMPAQYENDAMLKWGQESPVHPSDDDREHVREHIKAYQAAPEGTPAKRRLGAHIQQHIMSFQQKAMAMAGGGSGPMDFADAGRPGQPMAQTGSTEQAVASRQDSNDAAFGGPPGGIAAGRPTGTVIRNGRFA